MRPLEAEDATLPRFTGDVMSWAAVRLKESRKSAPPDQAGIGMEVEYFRLNHSTAQPSL